MKKISIALTAAVLLLTTSAFAIENENVKTSIREGFKKDFTKAANVVWEQVSDFYFAEFLVNGKSMSAAYNENGELVGTSQLIASSELPIEIGKAITERFGGYKLSSTANEVNYDGGTSYYLTAENDNQVVKLKCNSVGVTVEKRTRK